MQHGPNEVFAVNLAALAREIALDMFPVDQIIAMHKLSDEEWTKIHAQPQFQAMLNSMIIDIQGATGTRERMKAKAQIGLEMQLEQFILDMGDTTIPLAQRVECAKFLARVGELDNVGGSGGGGFSIQLNIGTTTTTLEARPVLDLTAVDAEGVLPE